MVRKLPSEMVGNERNTVCRLCLCENSDLFCIFESKRMEGWTAADIIAELLQMQASVNDIYSQYICTECLEKLEDFKVFKQRCQSNKDFCDRVYTAKIESEVGADDTPDNDDEDRDESLCPSDTLFEKDPLDISEEEFKMKSLENRNGIHLPNENHCNQMSDSFYILVNKDDGKPTTVLDNFNSKNLTPRTASFKCTEPLPNSALSDNPLIHQFTLMRQQPLKTIADTLEGADNEGEGLEDSMPLKVEFHRDVEKDSNAEDEETDERSVSKGFMDPLSTLNETIKKDEDKSVNYMGSAISDRDVEGSPYHQSETNEYNDGLPDEEAVTNMETVANEGDSDVEEDLEGHPEIQHSSYPQSSTSACIDEEMFPFGEMAFNCATCSQTFHSRHKLKIHKCANIPRGYKCHICGKNYAHNRILRAHMVKHFQADQYSCNVCKKTFSQSCYLKRHEAIHQERKPFVCKTCGKDFVRKCQLCAHEISHGGERPYKCSLCDKSFVQNAHLKQHSRTHTGERPFQCLVCKKGFTQGGHLRQHLRVHSGERPYKCEICNKGFIQNSHLKLHQYVHTGVKPFLCTDCQKRFVAKNDLKRHRMMFHQNKPL